VREHPTTRTRRIPSIQAGLGSDPERAAMIDEDGANAVVTQRRRVR